MLQISNTGGAAECLGGGFPLCEVAHFNDGRRCNLFTYQFEVPQDDPFSFFGKLPQIIEYQARQRIIGQPLCELYV